MDNPAGCTALVLYAADEEHAADGPGVPREQTAAPGGGEGGSSMATPQANTETAAGANVLQNAPY